MSISNLGAANLLRNKNDQILRERQRAANVAEGLGGAIVNLKQAFDALSQRNEELESLLLGMTEQGVASEALGTIHVLKAKALQKKADDEYWTIAQKREANLKLAAEAEYDYRLKNDPSYRLNVAAESLLKAAEYSENGDTIRKIVGQMYATGKVRKVEEKDRMIAERIAEMKASARYETPKSVLPIPESIPPMRLEMDENNKEVYESDHQIASELRIGRALPVQDSISHTFIK